MPQNTPAEGERRFTRLGEYNIAWREWGAGGKPVMAIHGIPLNSSLWSRVGPLLAAKGYHLLAPEQLGLGHSEAPHEVDHSLHGQAEMMTRFAEEVIGSPYILYGHDLGGGIAQIMVTDPAYKTRHKVSKIVIGNSAVLDMWPVPKALAAIDLARGPEPEKIFTEEATGEMVAGFIASGLMTPEETMTAELMADIRASYATDESLRRHFIEYLKAMDNKWTVAASPAMSMWKRPALLLWAINDPFQPPHVSGVALAQIMPHATWKTVDSSHYYPLEAAEDVARIFVEWDAE